MKKKNLVVTQRDKQLLILLCAVVIGFLLYYFVIDPALEKGSSLKAEAQSAASELEYANNLVDNLSGLTEKESETREELSAKYASFFYSLKQERILYQLDTLMQQAGFDAQDCSFGDVVLTDNIDISEDLSNYSSYPLLDAALKLNPSLSEFVQDYISSDDEASADALSDDVIPACEVTISYEGVSYASLMKFLSGLEGLNKTLIVTQIDMETSDGLLEGEIVVTFYALPKIDESESDDFNFVPSNATGKSDPFN
jgi:type IV pilus assembly protein PilO